MYKCAWSYVVAEWPTDWLRIDHTNVGMYTLCLSSNYKIKITLYYVRSLSISEAIVDMYIAQQKDYEVIAWNN